MFKYPVTILLILLIQLQTFSKWCLIADFQANRDFIAKNLCINRLNIASCCKGKCFLDKKLAADESQQQSPDKGAQREEILLQVHTPGDQLPELVSFVFITKHSTRHLDGKSQHWALSFYPPPRTASSLV